MAVPDGFATYCCELLAGLGAVHSRRMFGGHGVYIDDVFVAIIVGETLYLKVDDETRPRFDQAGCRPFEYEARGKRQALGFRSVPPEAMDSPQLMQPWGRLALDAALRARAAPRRRRPRT
jgi:DNA transformation protein and related proteins